MSSVCRKGRVPNLHRHLSATEGLRVTGPTLLEDAIHWLTSGVWCLAGDGGSRVDFEGGREWGSSTPFQPRGLSPGRCFFIYSGLGLKGSS